MFLLGFSLCFDWSIDPVLTQYLNIVLPIPGNQARYGPFDDQARKDLQVQTDVLSVFKILSLWYFVP